MASAIQELHTRVGVCQEMGGRSLETMRLRAQQYRDSKFFGSFLFLLVTITILNINLNLRT